MALLAAAAVAQGVAPLPSALRPLGVASVAAALERSVGQPVPTARTAGQLDLKGRRGYIAQLVLDGPSTARLMLLITSAGHQAVADALMSAR